jgi:hypothetical protein
LNGRGHVWVVCIIYAKHPLIMEQVLHGVPSG